MHPTILPVETLSLLSDKLNRQNSFLDFGSRILVYAFLTSSNWWMVASVDCNDGPNRINIHRNLREVNSDCFIVSFSSTWGVITTMLNCTIVCYLLHETTHIVVISSSIKLKNWAINVTSCVPTETDLQIGTRFWEVNNLIFNHVESPCSSSWLPICSFLQQNRIEPNMFQRVLNESLTLGEVASWPTFRYIDKGPCWIHSSQNSHNNWVVALRNLSKINFGQFCCTLKNGTAGCFRIGETTTLGVCYQNSHVSDIVTNYWQVDIYSFVISLFFTRDLISGMHNRSTIRSQLIEVTSVFHKPDFVDHNNCCVEIDFSTGVFVPSTTDHQVGSEAHIHHHSLTFW